MSAFKTKNPNLRHSKTGPPKALIHLFEAATLICPIVTNFNVFELSVTFEIIRLRRLLQ